MKLLFYEDNDKEVNDQFKVKEIFHLILFFKFHKNPLSYLIIIIPLIEMEHFRNLKVYEMGHRGLRDV